MSNLGELKPAGRRRKTEPAIPPSLQNRQIRSPLPHEEAHAVYDTHPMRALKGIIVMGHPVHAGDEFSLVGNEGFLLAKAGAAEFTNPKLKEQVRVLAEAEALGLTTKQGRVQSVPLPPKQRPSWVTAPLAKDKG